MMVKKNFLPAAVAAALILISFVLVSYSVSLSKELDNLRFKQQELSRLSAEYRSLAGSVSAVESKRSLSKVTGIVQAVDEVFQSIGLRQKVKSVKLISTRDLNDAVEEDAEVLVEKVDMNELVNIFYWIDSAPMVLAVKSTNIKTSFDTPERLNASLTLSFIKSK